VTETVTQMLKISQENFLAILSRKTINNLLELERKLRWLIWSQSLL